MWRLRQRPFVLLEVGLKLLVATLSALICATPPDAMTQGEGHHCADSAGFYSASNGRRAWVKRVGLTSRLPSLPIQVIDVMFDDGHTYFLVGRDTQRMLFRYEIGSIERTEGPIAWLEISALPGTLVIAGDDGSPGPVLSFVRCEPTPSLSLERRKEFWE
jgi:hypothetical protein